MEMPETANGVLFELHAWQSLVKSQEWIYFRKLLGKHTDYLQKECNERLRKGQKEEAGQSLRAMDDSIKILDLVTKRINELTKISEKGEK